MRGFVDKLAAVIRRDLLMMVRYRGGFWIQMAGLLAEVAGFFFLARSIGPGYRPEGIAYFPFVLVGTGFYTFLVAGMTSFVASVHEAQVTGTMEVLMTSATPAPLIVFLTALSAFCGRAAQFAFVLLVGFVVFGIKLENPNYAAAVLAFVLSLTVAVSIGMMAAAVQIATQRGSSLLWLIASTAALTTGTMFPVSVLPKPLLALARAIPITYSLDALRGALLHGFSFSALRTPLVVLGAYSVVLVPFSLWTLARSIRCARRDGTLSLY